MNGEEKISNPIESIIDFAWANGADRFWVNNAKDEFKKLKSTNEKLNSIQNALDSPVAWAKNNDRGDLYDLRLQNNPYDDQTKIVPLYRINHE